MFFLYLTHRKNCENWPPSQYESKRQLVNIHSIPKCLLQDEQIRIPRCLTSEKVLSANIHTFTVAPKVEAYAAAVYNRNQNSDRKMNTHLIAGLHNTRL